HEALRILEVRMLTTTSCPDHDLVAGLDTPLHVLREDGTRGPEPLLDPLLRDVDREMLTGLYLDMAVVRAIDDEAVALQRQGELAAGGAVGVAVRRAGLQAVRLRSLRPAHGHAVGDDRRPGAQRRGVRDRRAGAERGRHRRDLLRGWRTEPGRRQRGHGLRPL